MAQQLAELKAVACAAIDAAADHLHEVSRAIWSHPELAFQERQAHDLLTQFLEGRGFQVTRQYILDTGFKATLRSPSANTAEDGIGNAGVPDGGPASTISAGHVGLMCEYDALPGVGHACGHNLIAEVALAAGLGLRAVMTSLPGGSRVTVFGTPAEEGGAGKVTMATAGAFADLDAALMAHPYRRSEARPLVLSRVALVAEFSRPPELQDAEAKIDCRSSETVNPTDAAVLAYQAAASMRSCLRRHCMMHCVLRDCDSPRPDVTPRRAVLEFYLRAPSESDFAELRRRLTACFEAAAMATGCRVDVTQAGPAYRSLLSNRSLSDAYAENLRHLGDSCLESDSDEPAGSTDMGNVSHLVPSIHPMWRLEAAGQDSTPPNHSHEFARLAGQPEAQAAALRQAKALAMTAIDILAAGLRQRARREFAEGAK